MRHMLSAIKAIMKIIQYFKTHKLETIFVAITIIILIVTGALTHQPLYKTLATIISIFMLVFLIKGSPIAFIIGLVYYSLYGIICFTEKVYGAFILNVCVTLPVQIFSLINWGIHAKKAKAASNNSDNANEKAKTQIKPLSNILRIVCAVSAILASIGGYFILKVVGSVSPVLDALAMCFSITSLILLVFAKYEQWIFNILGNAFNAILWGTLITANITNINIFIICIIFSIYGIIGFINWVKIYKNSIAKPHDAE